MILFVVQLCQKILLIRYWQFPDLERLICRLCYREWLVKKKKHIVPWKRTKLTFVRFTENSLRHIQEKVVRDFAVISTNSMHFQISCFRLSLPQYIYGSLLLKRGEKHILSIFARRRCPLFYISNGKRNSCLQTCFLRSSTSPPPLPLPCVSVDNCPSVWSDFNPRMVSGLEFYSSSSVNSPWKKDTDLLRHVSADNCPLVRLQLKDIAQNCSNLNVYLRSRRFMRSSLMFFCDYVWSAQYSTSIDDTSAILRREFLTFKSVNLAF